MGVARWGWGSLGLLFLIPLPSILSYSQSVYAQEHIQDPQFKQVIAKGVYKDQEFIITQGILKQVIALQEKHGTFFSLKHTLDELIET